MVSLRALLKEYAAPASATSGLAGYSLEGQKPCLHGQPRGWGCKTCGVRSVLKAARVRYAASVDGKAHEAATSPFNLRPEPTEGQKTSGSYKKGSFKIGGLDVRIENPAGSKRRPEWPTLQAHYGYFAGTTGADGDGVDLFVRVGTSLDYDGPAYVINQYVDGAFDEHKVMLGWNDWESARAAYQANFTPDWDGLRSAFELSLGQLKDWLFNGEPDQELDRFAASLISAADQSGGRMWVNKRYLTNRLAAGL